MSDIFEMSDSDFLNSMDAPAPVEEVVEDTAEAEEVIDEASEEASLIPESEEADDEDELPEAEDDTEEEEVESEVGDYEKMYKELLEPFNAHGKQMSVKDVAEARKLMQMGVDYAAKMRDMKPHRKLLKTLEKNNLLDESKLNYLIDLDKRNPEAISKLLKDSGLDPFELSTEEEVKYTPSNHTVSDSEVELDEVLSRIQEDASFTDTMTIVRTGLDDSSKRILAANPQTLERLHQHIATGVYAQVMEEVERVRMFGGLSNLSDLEAYQQVGAQMHERGDFNAKAQVKPKVVRTNPHVDSGLKDKKRKVGTIKNSSSQVQGKYNPLALSDEEFLKQFGH